MANPLSYLTTPGLGSYALGGKSSAKAPQVTPGVPVPPNPQDPKQQQDWLSDLLSYLGGPLAPVGGKDWASKLSDFAFGKSGGPQPIQQYSPTGASLLDYLASQGVAESQFEPIAKQAVNRFQTETVPGLIERFQAMPGSNRASSGLAGQLGSSAQRLNEGLAALQSQYGLQKAGIGLRPQYTVAQAPGSQGFAQALLPYLPMLLGGL